jgi:hypothetical protein
MTTRRFVPLGIALALVAAACGADDPGAGSDDGLRPPVPVQVSAGGADAAGARAASEMAADGDTIDGSFMPWFGGFEYEIGPGLPALPTDSTGYQFVPGDVDVTEVTRLAEALGVTGEPVRGDADVDGRLWQVGPDDGTAPSLTVVADAQSSWYYSSAWADPATSGTVNEPCRIASVDGGPLDGGPVDDGLVDDAELGRPVEEICPEPTPPAGVPSSAEAEADVRARLAAMGLDPATFEYEVFADEWYASVTASRPLGSVSSPVSWNFGFGAEAALQWAGGYLGEPVATGPYPLIDLEAALARLADQSGMWGGIMARADVAVAADASDAAIAPEPETVETTLEGTVPPETVPVETEPPETVPVETVPPETVPVETVPPETVPVETVPPETVPEPVLPEPEPVVAVLVDVRADLWWAWDADGSIWLLPAYTFTDTEGRTHTVPAVTEEYLIVVEPEPMPEPMPAEPLDPVMVDPFPGDPGDGGDIDAQVALDDFAGLVGMTVDDATAKLQGGQTGVTIRVIRLDGEDLAATMDYLPTRINVAVEGDVITELISVG